MASIKLFWVLLLGVVATTLAASVEVEAKPETPTSVEADDSEEIDGRGFWSTSKGEQRCNCDNVSCQCCVNPKVPVAGTVEACMKIIVLANEKAVNLQLTGKGRNLVNHKFRIGSRERICASLPGSMSAVQGCINTDTSNLHNNAGIQTCPKLEIRAVGKTVATLSFACVQYANRRVSFNNNGPVKANEKVQFKILLIITCSLLHTIYHNYKLASDIAFGWDASDVFMIAVIFLIMVDVQLLSVLIHCCTSAANESRRFNVLLYQIMVQCKDPHISSDHKLRMHLLSKWQVTFSAGGFFDIDNTVFQSIIGATVTYVVMLRQFGSPYRPHRDPST